MTDTPLPPRDTVLPSSDGAAPPRAVATPMAIAGVVARNLVPVIGIVFFGWSASIVIALFFVDTLLAMMVMNFGLVGKFVDNENATTPGDRIKAWAKWSYATSLYVLLMAFGLGIPLVIFLGGQETSLGAIVRDPGFQWGLAAQVFASAMALSAFLAEIKPFRLAQIKVKRRFGLLFLRWYCVILVGMTPLVLLGRFAALLLVVVYAGLSVYAELAPSRFLAHFDADKDEEDPKDKSPGLPADPSASGQPDREAILRSQQRHERRHGKR